MHTIETALSPTLLQHFDSTHKVLVVIDVLRATSVICTMFMNGVKEVYPVSTLEQALQLKQLGYTVVAERNGQKVDFADYGNSPLYFTPQTVGGKTVVYSTTNGTQAINAGEHAQHVIVASFINFSAVKKFIANANADVLFLCAGWKGKFCIEDTMLAGALAHDLLHDGTFSTTCDSTNAAMDIWRVAQPNIPAYLERVAQRHRLRKLGFDDVIDYCFTRDLTQKLPILRDGRLVAI